MDDLRQLYHVWSEQLIALWNWKRPEHRKVLAWMMVAIFVGKDVCLDRLGLYLPREAKPESVGQQFRRWLKNDAIDVRLIYDPVARQILQRLRCRRLRIQIDRVQIKRRQNVLMMSVRYRERAVPLAWICLPYGQGNSHFRHWRTLMDYLETLLQADQQVVILADREFGGVRRLRYVARKNWQYAVRLKGSTWFYDPIWKHPFDWLKLKAIAPTTGERYALTDIKITKANRFSTHLAYARASGSHEPWFIATNLPQPLHALKEYGRRFGCEELFSDLKKRGFNWEDSRLPCPKRFARFLLALALLVVFLLTLGRHLRLHHYDLEITSPSHRRRLSLFQTARRWLRRRLSMGRLPDWIFFRPFWHFA